LQGALKPTIARTKISLATLIVNSMKSSLIPPPPVLDSAYVVCYAFVPDSIEFINRRHLYVDGVLLGRVTRLAICENLGEDIGPMLCHCDEEWNSLGVSGASTIEEIKQSAERNYPGIGEHWQDSVFSRDEAQTYYDAEAEAYLCSFCGKRPYEMLGGCVKGNNAVICRDCVERLHSTFGEIPIDDE